MDLGKGEVMFNKLLEFYSTVSVSMYEGSPIDVVQVVFIFLSECI